MVTLSKDKLGDRSTSNHLSGVETEIEWALQSKSQRLASVEAVRGNSRYLRRVRLGQHLTCSLRQVAHPLSPVQLEQLYAVLMVDLKPNSCG